MKRFMKIMLILAAVLAAVGIGLTVGGIALGATTENLGPVQMMKKAWRTAGRAWTDGWEASDFSEQNDTGDDVTEHEFADVTELEVELKSEELLLARYDGDKILVNVKNDPENTVKIKKESSNRLTVKSKKAQANRTIIIYYPETLKFKKIDIEIEAGRVEIMDRLAAEKLDLSVGAGEFINSGVLTADELDIEVAVGNAEVARLISGKVDGECGIGSISLELAGDEEDYNYNLECGVGEINLTHESYSGLGREKVLKHPGASKNVNLECGMGNISVSFTGEPPADMLKTTV